MQVNGLFLFLIPFIQPATELESKVSFLRIFKWTGIVGGLHRAPFI
jgi:hypothetical protein